MPEQVSTNAAQPAVGGIVVEREHSIPGKTKLPFRFSECGNTASRAAPLLAQQNRENTCELGLSDADIDNLVTDGVLQAKEAVGRQLTGG